MIDEKTKLAVFVGICCVMLIMFCWGYWIKKRNISGNAPAGIILGMILAMTSIYWVFNHFG